jgi:hypothetical protein
LPQSYRNNKIFIKAWLEFNQSKVITLNGTERCIINRVSNAFKAHDDSRIHLISYCENISGKRIGTQIEYMYDKGSDVDPLINLCIDDKKGGLWKTRRRDFNHGGHKETICHYDNNYLNGPHEVRYNGVVLTKGNYDNGKMIGFWEVNYHNYDITITSIRPQCREFYVKPGVLDGERNTYHGNGVIELQEFYTNGNRTGIHKKFHTNGKVSNTYEYDGNGYLTGDWKVFNPNGKLIQRTCYKKGVIRSKRSY